MINKILLLLAFASLLAACGDEPKEDSFKKVDANVNEAPANATPMEQVQSAAIEETNYIERVRQSFIPLQEEYKKSSGVVPGVGEVNVFVDENYQLLIENKDKGHTYQTKVDLKSLKTEKGGLALMADSEPGTFPALKIYVREGHKAVEHFKDGKLEKKEDFILFTMSNRGSIERIAPSIVQGLNIVNGKMPKTDTGN